MPIKSHLNRPRARALSCALLSLSLFVTPTHAQPMAPPMGDGGDLGRPTQAAPSDNTSARTLAGHRFITSERGTSPFLTTHFSAITGVGFANINAPVDALGQRTSKNRKYPLGYLSEGFDIQVALKPWLAVRGNIAGSVLAPASGPAALLIGAQVGYDYKLGASLRLFSSDRFQASFSVDRMSASKVTINVISALQDSIDAGSVSIDTLLNQSDESYMQSGLHLALGVASWLGVFGTLEYIGVEEGAYNSVLGVSLDLNPLSDYTPIGSSIVYNKNGETVVYGFGLFYTGRDNLILGLEGGLSNIDLPNDGFIDIYEGLIKMRYFW